jgi:uncharacterized membrane protein HdeD (DUF308 family)
MAEVVMTISAVTSIVLGLLTLVFPRLLRWPIGLYLVVTGVVALVSVSFAL